MQFVRVANSNDGAGLLRDRLAAELAADKSVLWLIPGGSNIPLSVSVMNDIPGQLTSNLSLALTDERYGNIGHPDSNWWQLDQAGFDDKQARRFPVLIDKNLSATVNHYNDVISQLIMSSDVIIGQFGMGADGHIAGILPDSPAVSATNYVAGYHTATYTRITCTFEVIRRCTAAYLYAFGDNKREALEHLQTRRAVSSQPAQILHQLADAFVINDQIGNDKL